MQKALSKGLISIGLDKLPVPNQVFSRVANERMDLNELFRDELAQFNDVLHESGCFSASNALWRAPNKNLARAVKEANPL